VRAHGRNRDALFVIFAVTGGAWAWTLQLWLSWILAEPLCFLQPSGFRLAGLDSNALWILIGLATGALTLTALLASFGLWRDTRESATADAPASRRRRFLSYVGLVLNALFLVTIVMGATSPLFLEPCT